ncbi:hypothetical protein ACEWY4_003025 [Coilia grayii]|uniref:DM14 domain-containing protein n=1 Tax=Coilia grayii TaxID=363190 RepID=A0ABD1KQ25_9TELE
MKTKEVVEEHGHDDDDDDDVESNTDLLAELKELLKEDGAQDSSVQAQASTLPLPHSATAPSTGSEALQLLLIGRIDAYRAAIEQAEAAGAAGRERRYRRGLKTLETMLESARRGDPVSETEIPPPLPVTHSTPPSAHQTVQPVKDQKHRCPDPGMPSSDDDNNTSHSAYTDSDPTLQVLSRLKEYKVAAVQAKQAGHMQLARRYYHTAKELESIVESSKEGLLPDIRSLPPPPGQTPEQSGSEDESPLLSHTPTAEEDHTTAEACWEADNLRGQVEDSTWGVADSPGPPPAEDSYTYLIDLFLQQQQRCLAYCQQFSHMGNIEETTRFEELAERSAQHAEVLRESQRRGHPAPQYHAEECTVNTYRINPDLTGSELELIIVKGINLPVATVFDEHFKLFVKKDHRALKRVIQSKGIKFEIVQKEGLFKTDKAGSAQLKLDSLETQCGIRQLIEVTNRRRATGGHLEVQVRVREPLGGPQPHTVIERWLVLDSHALPMQILCMSAALSGAASMSPAQLSLSLSA